MRSQPLITEPPITSVSASRLMSAHATHCDAQERVHVLAAGIIAPSKG